VDDLTKLTGVGPELEKKLNEAGVFHYWQVAVMTEADIAAVDSELKLNGRIARDGWIETAKALVA
jgi:small subunit ribosomal protein S2